MNELLKHYSAEEIEELKNSLKPTDAKERIANSEKIDELLKNSNDPSVEANNILLAEVEAEKRADELMFNDEYDEALEIYVERGTAEDVFYKTLIKEANIKVLYEEVLDMLDGDGDNIVIADEKDKKFVREILKNKVISFLISSYPDRESQGKILEEEQLIPKGTTKRLLIRVYEDHIKRCDNAIKNLHPKENKKRYQDEKFIWQEKLKAINQDNSFPAISDAELEKIMSDIIQKYLKNK